MIFTEYEEPQAGWGKYWQYSAGTVKAWVFYGYQKAPSIVIESDSKGLIRDEDGTIKAEDGAEEVDFFSIGTNDLTQYTLAIDRQNEKLDLFYEAHHPAILRMIEMTVKAGHKYGAWVGICGELGADQRLTQRFLEMGMDELSVAPSSVLPIRKLIREVE